VRRSTAHARYLETYANQEGNPRISTNRLPEDEGRSTIDFGFAFYSAMGKVREQSRVQAAGSGLDMVCHLVGELGLKWDWDLPIVAIIE